MWRHIGTLVILLAFAGVGPASMHGSCTDCWPNSIHQQYISAINDVVLAEDASKDVVVGNEGIMAGVIVAPASAATSIIAAPADVFVHAPLGRIDQIISQTLSNIGSKESGAKGTTMNKALQASWIQNQGMKENDPKTSNSGTTTPNLDMGSAYTFQRTCQNIVDITNYGHQDDARIYNADSKLAMIVDDINAINDMTSVV